MTAATMTSDSMFATSRTWAGIAPDEPITTMSATGRK